MKQTNKDYKLSTHIGPGGIGCPCCTRFGSVKENRIHINRVFRRSKKQDISTELEEIEENENL